MMNRKDVPHCMRTPLSVSLAAEDGKKAGKMGLPADVMPEGLETAQERRVWLSAWNAGRKMYA